MKTGIFIEDSRPSNFIIVMIILILMLFVGSIDEGIVSSSKSLIESDLNVGIQVSLLEIIYLVTFTVSQILYFGLWNIYGPKSSMMISLIIFFIGNITCAISYNFYVLLIFRIISALGSGGFMLMNIMYISQTINIKMRALFLCMIYVIYSIGNIIGHLIGFALASTVIWRISFVVSIPFTSIALIVLLMWHNNQSIDQCNSKPPIKMDFLSVFLLLVALILLILALNSKGVGKLIDFYVIVILIISSIILLVILITYEVMFSKSPIICNSELFDRNLVISCIIGGCLGSIFYVFIYFIPLYHVSIYSQSYIRACLELLPLFIGTIIGTFIGAIITIVSGKYKIISLFGTIFLIIVTWLMHSFRIDISRLEIIMFLLLVGLGFGLCIVSVYMSAHASSKDPIFSSYIITFFINLGGAISVSFVGAIYEAISYPPAIDDTTPNYDMTTGNGSNMRNLNIPNPLKENIVISLRYCFVILLIYAFLAFFCSFLIRSFPLVPDMQEKVIDSKSIDQNTIDQDEPNSSQHVANIEPTKEFSTLIKIINKVIASMK